MVFPAFRLCQRSLRKRMKANHNWMVQPLFLTCVVSKIVEKKNESKSQPLFNHLKSDDVVSKIVEKKNESKSQPAERTFTSHPVVSKIVEKKNESKSQLNRSRCN